MDDINRSLSRMLAAGEFEPFIRYIRFPHFRNLRSGTQIEFGFPVTALVGPNGTNKTAVLRALQGCPDYYNVGQYWFSTALDPIPAGDRHRFIHGYYAPSVGHVVEAIKTRIGRRDPDYFEPSRPILQDGMSKMPEVLDGEELATDRVQTRWKAIQKEVVYLDFRSELSAYDKYFYHMPFKDRASTLTEKKSVIRRRSRHLARSLSTRRKAHSFYGSNRLLSPAVELENVQREAISDILGRHYDSIVIMRHRYFDVEGATVVLATHGLQYSEAFAGSGEFAVSTLVHAVADAKPRSLILLDEPEVSLHPGAQRRLMDFLCEQSKLGRHQIVITTHSPEIVSSLPPDAIKVFLPSATDGKVELVGQSSHSSEAFFRLGARPEQTKRIYVEDRLAVALVQRAIRSLGEAVNAQLEITPLPGGASSIQTKFIPAFAVSGYTNCLVLLDGDQRPSEPLPEASSVPDAAVAGLVRTHLRGNPRLSPSGSGGRAVDDERLSLLRTVLEWARANVDFLPGDSPDSLLLALEGHPTSVDSSDSKAEWERRARSALGLADWETVSGVEILAEQKRALARIDESATAFEQIRARVTKFFEESAADG